MEKKEVAFNPGNFIGDFSKVLASYWERFLFLLPNIFFAILLLVIFLLLASRVRRLLTNRITSQAHDQITAGYLAIVSQWIIAIVGILLACQALGLSGVASGLLASAGVSAVVIGFAFKDIAENFLAGIILAFNRPFDVQDTVKINDLMGKIVTLELRVTHIQTFDGKDVFIPNGTILTSPVTNFTRNGRIRMDFLVGIDYNDSIEKAIELIESTVGQIGDILSDNPPFAAVEELATNTVNIRVFFWTQTDDYRKGALQLKGKVMMEVKNVLLANGFGLPANIQELKLYDYQKSFPVNILSNPRKAEQPDQQRSTP